MTLEAPNGDIIEVGVDRRPKQWKVTERTTGLLLITSDYSTREQAQAALTPELLQKVAVKLKEPHALRLANELADYILQEGANR